MKNLVILAAVALFSAGCSLDASLQNISETVKFQDPAKTTGLVSGSTQTGTATGSGVTYHVQSTIGNYVSGMSQKTSDGKYTVYSSVQGAIVSNSNQ